MADLESTRQDWLSVIGKSVAYLCLHTLQGGNKTIADKAAFLQGLGLARKDIAEMLGTTPASISELLRQAKNRKGARRRGAKKK